MDVDREIAHWLKGAESDMDAVRLLFDGEKYLHALFWSHLVVEKTIKAHIVKRTKGDPPKIHNLIRLAELAGIDLDVDQREFATILNEYCLEGRYAEIWSPEPERSETEEFIRRAEEFRLWLLMKFEP